MLYAHAAFRATYCVHGTTPSMGSCIEQSFVEIQYYIYNMRELDISPLIFRSSRLFKQI